MEFAGLQYTFVVSITNNMGTLFFLSLRIEVNHCTASYCSLEQLVSAAGLERLDRCWTALLEFVANLIGPLRTMAWVGSGVLPTADGINVEPLPNQQYISNIQSIDGTIIPAYGNLPRHFFFSHWQRYHLANA
jgi:hypothetical protein